MASYFVTGGTGFIGRAVVARLAATDRDSTIYLLVRDASLPRFERLIADLGHELAPQVVPVAGDAVSAIVPPAHIAPRMPGELIGKLCATGSVAR